MITSKVVSNDDDDDDDDDRLGAKTKRGKSDVGIVRQHRIFEE